MMPMPYMIEIDREKCTRCLACAEVCGERSIAFKLQEKDVSQNMTENYDYFARMFGYPVQVRKCTGCAKCVDECKLQGGGLSIKRVRNEPKCAKPPFYQPRRFGTRLR